MFDHLGPGCHGLHTVRGKDPRPSHHQAAGHSICAEMGEATQAAVIEFQDRLSAAGYQNQYFVSRIDDKFAIELFTDRWETRILDTRAEVEQLLDQYARGWR
jgi:hypothetical protein